MKKTFLFLLFANAGAFAESRVLPPVIDNSSYTGGSAYSTTAPSNNAMYEVLSRLEQLQQEVQQLRGNVEEQSQIINDIKKRQANIYSDLDQRLQMLSTGADQNNSDSELNVQNEQATDNNLAIEQPIDSSQNSVTDDIPINKVDNEVLVKNEKELYKTAYELLRNGHNTRAIMEFKSFLEKFPNGEFSDNSQYWLGEAYKVNQDLNSSKAAFTKVITDFPSSTKVSDSLLKLGYIELEQKNIAKARDYLTRVTASYPDTTAAHLARKKLMQMGSLLH